MRNAWNDSDILKRVTIRRLEIAREEGRLVRETPLSGYFPTRTGPITDHMWDDDSNYDFPGRFGMPRSFAFLLAMVFRWLIWLDRDEALTFATDVLEAIQPGADLVPAMWDFAVHMVRNHRGADNPAVAEAIKTIVRLAEPFCGDNPVKARYFVALDAMRECEYRRELIREKRGPRSPQASWAIDAAMSAVCLADVLLHANDFPDQLDEAFRKFVQVLAACEYDESCAAYLITALKRRRDSDGDQEPYRPRLPHGSTPIPA